MNRLLSQQLVSKVTCLLIVFNTGFILASDLPGSPDAPTKTQTLAPTSKPKAPAKPAEKSTAAAASSPKPTQTPAAPTSEHAPAAPASTPEPTATPEPEAPAKPAEKSTAAPAQSSPAPMPVKEVKPMPKKEGLDTIDIEEGGNWLLKRKALEDTADTIEKIVNNFSKILEASTTFKIKRNKLDNDYDLYIATVGFNLGDLDQVLTNLMDELERERKEEGELSADERATLDTIKEKKNDIKQLQEDLKALATVDSEIDKVVDTVDSQIKTANNYQNQAWKNFQEIKKVLSDEKAEELYYRTVSLQKSMQEIYTYLTTTLSSYFSNQIDTMRSKMDSIKSKIGALQAKGVDLQKEIDKLEQEDTTRDEARAQEEQEEAIEKAKQEAEKKRQEASWWNSIKNALYWPFVQIAKLFNFIADSIFNLFKAKPVQKPAPEEPAMPTPDSVEPPAPTNEEKTEKDEQGDK